MEQPKGIIVKYTADRMKAFVMLSKSFGQINAGMVLTELLHKGIVHGLRNAMIHKIIAASHFDMYVEVAQGTDATPGTDGRVEVLAGAVERAVDAKGEPITAAGGKAGDNNIFDRIVIVKAGDRLARRVPPVPGVDGMDVFGNALPAPPVKDAALVGGGGVVSAQNDPNLLVAVHGGIFKYGSGGLAEVHPYREIDGDVSSAAGRVSFTGDLKIAGAIRQGSAVEVSGMLMVLGVIEGAAVKCGGDLSVGAGVRGAGAAVVECGGSAWAACIESAKFTSGGGVTVTEGIANSVVNAKGIVKARSIVGGKITAAGGVLAETVGDEGNAFTEIDVGAIHRYASERVLMKSTLETQHLLSEGYVSELFSYVRDNMDAEGRIPDDKLRSLEHYKNSMTGSAARCEEIEKKLQELEELLEELADCNIKAAEIRPNVLLKLGFANQQVKETLKNVLLKPSGAK
ncbi:MAG: FapA family protein [Chitinispirillales bacterium]|jgi:uncharacterized protein (DUF342 family)|nr:FapA family protein [Chitinispirillales bacterium]